MKKKLYIWLICFCCCWMPKVHAQQIKLYIQGGVSAQRNKVNGWGLQPEYYFGQNFQHAMFSYIAGVWIQDSISKRLSILSGIQLNEKGYTSRFVNIQTENYVLQPVNTQRRLHFSYIDIPILLDWTIFPHTHVLGGLAYSRMLHQQDSTIVNRFDIPIQAGFAYQVKRIRIQGTYQRGTIPYHQKNFIAANGEPNYFLFFHRGLYLQIGYIINSKVDGCKSCKQPTL